MNNFIKTAKRLGTSAILLLGTCLTAQAQFSTGGSAVTSPVCQTHLTPTNTPGTPVTYSITLPANQTFSPWTTRGDISISNPTNVGSVYSITVTSTGFGRGRLAFNTIIGSCGPTPTYLVINKTFPARPTTDLVIPPGCIEPGNTYAFTVPPIISSAAQINEQIGIDTYTWSLVPLGAGTIVNSGDGSAATITLSGALTSSFTVNVQTGACNGGKLTTRTVNIQPTQPVLALVAGSGIAACKSDLASFALSYSAQANVNYAWSVPAGWGITYSGTPSPAVVAGGLVVKYTTNGPQTVTITPSNATFGDISVTASYPGGSCSNRSLIFPVTRQLTTAASPITQTPAGCLTPGASVTFSFANPFSANTTFQWTLPPGWTTTGSTSNLITATVGAAGTVPVQVTAQVTGCGTGGTVLPVAVSGTTVIPTGGGAPITCSYTLSDLGFGLYRILRDAPQLTVADCLPEQYFFTITGPGPTFTPIASSPANTAPPTALNNTQLSYQAQVAVPAGSTVKVVGTKRSNCLSTTQTITVPAYIPRGVANPGNGGGSVAPLTEQPVVYPNPVGNLLQVDLPVKKAGTSRLTLTDALGRTVLTRTSEGVHATLDVRGLPDGTYTLRTTVPGGKEQAQLVVVQH